MIRTILAAVLVLAPASAIAQQQQPPSPAQAALAINQAISNMAMALEGTQQQIAHLQAEASELKQKCGDRCAPAPQAVPPK